MSVFILIPSFNPDEKLLKLIKDIYHSNFFIVLVDDGSLSGLNIFEEIKIQYPKVVLLNHNENKGKGAALKTGISHIRSISITPGIVTVDADGQHLPVDILNISSQLKEKPDFFYLGTRNFSGIAPLKSTIGNYIISYMLKFFFGMYINDTQTGLRGIPNHLLSKLIELPGDRYEYETSVIIYLIKNKIPVKYIPISTVYIDNNSRTNFKPIADSIRIIKVVLKNLFNNFN